MFRLLGIVLDHGLRHLAVERLALAPAVADYRITNSEPVDLRQFRALTPPDLHDIVYQLGYYDEPHFIHEFKKYAHSTPKRYLLRKQRQLWTGYVQDTDKQLSQGL